MTGPEEFAKHSSTRSQECGPAGLPREKLPSVFAPLQHLRDLCGGISGAESSASCPLSLPTPKTNDNQGLPFGNTLADEGLEAMYTRAEYLSDQLRSSVEQLQDRVMRTWARSADNLNAANRGESNTGNKPAATDAVALQQALDTTVKLATTMTAALRFSEKEAKALHLLEVAEGESKSRSLDLGASVSPQPKTATAGPSTSQLRAFIANIEGSPLLAVPRSMYGQLLRTADHLKSTPTLKESRVRRRRLQAATIPPLTGPARSDGLVLVDPLVFSSLLGNLRSSDGPGILGMLKETVTRGASMTAAADAGTAEVSFGCAV